VPIYSERPSTSHPLIVGAPQKNNPAAASPAPTTPAGEYIYRRFNVCPVIADLVASLAGLGPNQRAA
jgi:hypothetical protein